MILRGPGAKADPPYPPQDLKVYDLIGKEGEKLLPGYHYFISWKDLYTVHGATTDHFYSLMGALAFTNEMYNPPADFDKNGEVTDEELMKFNDELAFGRQFVDWHPYNHPQYGAIEIGGFKRDVGRVPEGWALEDETHRNNSFALLNAYHLPRLSIGEAMVKKAGDRLWKIEVPVLNDRAIPSMTATAVQNKLHRAGRRHRHRRQGDLERHRERSLPRQDRGPGPPPRPPDGAGRRRPLHPHPLLPGPGGRRRHRPLRQPEGRQALEENRPEAKRSQIFSWRRRHSQTPLPSPAGPPLPASLPPSGRGGRSTSFFPPRSTSPRASQARSSAWHRCRARRRENGGGRISSPAPFPPSGAAPRSRLEPIL